MDSKNAVALGSRVGIDVGRRRQAAESLEEVVVESAYTTGDRLDTATGRGLTIIETPQSVTESDTALYERIEIVRGATGLLTGAGDPSASINLVRKHADSREFEGFATLGFGRWSQRNAMVDIGSPLGLDDRVRGRVVLNYEEGDSFVRRLGNSSRLRQLYRDFQTAGCSGSQWPAARPDY